MSELAFSITPFAVLFSVGLFLFCLWHSVATIRRTEFRRSVILLEWLRLMIALIIGATMLQPEWVRTAIPDTKPTLLVLQDESNSMQTPDAVSFSSESDLSVPLADRMTRSQATHAMLTEQRLKSLGSEMNVVVQKFSSQLNDPGSGSDLNDPLQSALEKYQRLRAVVMVSDGDWNTGQSPSQTATSLRARDIRVFGIGVGSEVALPDLKIVDVETPALAVMGKPTRIPWAISSTMPQDAIVDIKITTGDGRSETIQRAVPANGVLKDVFKWRPTQIGTFDFKIEMKTQADEAFTHNNSLTMPIEVREETLKVLVVESFPRWEYRYLRNALSRDSGVDVTCLLYHPSITEVARGADYIESFPATPGELSQYDVIFLGDVGVEAGQLSADDCRNIKHVVESQATGLILMPGLRGRQISLANTEMSALFPVVLDQQKPTGTGSPTAANFELTVTGKNSLLTQLADSPDGNERVWNSLPGFQWYAPVLRAKRGSEVLAVHETATNASGRIPLLTTKTFGNGKILFMGTDGAWRWRQGVEDKYHYRFWGQVARWMAYRRAIAGERFFYEPERPRLGQTVSLTSHQTLPDGQPLNNGNVLVKIQTPSGATRDLSLSADTDAVGAYNNSFRPDETGRYQLTVLCRETGQQAEVSLHVQPANLETIGDPARFETLREISAITRGEMCSIEDFESLIGLIQNLPAEAPQITRTRIWAHPLWAGLTILLLGILWTARKSARLI